MYSGDFEAFSASHPPTDDTADQETLQARESGRSSHRLINILPFCS